MDRLRLHLAVESRAFPSGLDDILRSDLERLSPPSWADGIRLVGPDDQADAVVMLFNLEPSDRMRRVFFSSFRRAVPIAGLCLGEPSTADSIYSRLREWGSWWVFTTAQDARAIASGPLQRWLRQVERDSSPFPSGDDLLASYGPVDEDKIDSRSLKLAEDVLMRRGFVCLSGPLGSGKTTLARYLLSRASDEGLNPVEVISADLDSTAVESLLTGPEDCAVFFDLDTLRRFTDLWSSYVWTVALSLMIRATESRRRLVLASSSPRIEAIFETYGDAHVTLPGPSEKRGWRLEQGRSARRRLLKLDPLDLAEHVLLAAFDPVIPESMFKASLSGLWERLSILERRRFPSARDLEEMYEGSFASRGEAPFRRVRIAGEMNIVAGDALLMAAIDEVFEELVRKRSRVIHALGDVLLNSPEPRVRKAGIVLAHFYRSLSDEDRATLLHSTAREQDHGILLDTLTVLLRSPKHADDALLSLAESIAADDSPDRRRALAEVCASLWARSDARMAAILDALSRDPVPDVRASLMRGIAMWGGTEDPGGYCARLIHDPSIRVRTQAMVYLGGRFPRLNRDEMAVVDEALSEGDGRILRSLAWGLLTRETEEFSTEFTDLLWVILDRMPPGGRGLVARQVGGRLRYFDMDVRRALVSNLEEEDRTAVVLCLLMNYSWLTAEESQKLWSLVSDRIAGDMNFASLVLRYFSSFEPARRSSLVRSVLTAEAYSGREALSQLIGRARWDLAETALEVSRSITGTGTPEERSRLAWFVIWNLDLFDGEGMELVGRMLEDESPLVRSSLARAMLKQGVADGDLDWVLPVLASDSERSVRAVAGEAIGKLAPGLSTQGSEALERLLSDPEPSVRSRTLWGVVESVTLPAPAKLQRLSRMLSDPSPGVHREIAAMLKEYSDLLSDPGAPELVSELLSDPDEKTRIETARLVTATPGLISAEAVRKRLPDLLLDRGTSGATIIDELSTAREIQKEFLPDSPPRLESYDIEFYYSPAREIGGDYYDFFPLPEDNLGFAVGDVSGKGIPAALTMAALKGSLAARVRNIYSIAEIIRQVNESLCEAGEATSLVGLFYGVLNTRTGTLTYVNAGHNPPVLVKREGQTKLLTEGGLLLGASSEARYSPGIVRLEAADVLLLYTDGISEAKDTSDSELGLMALVELAVSFRDLSARQMILRILEAVNRHSAGAPRSDDQTLVVIRRR